MRLATRSINDSVTNVDTGRPTPRYGPMGALFVATPHASPR
jgi:hypothetical protein